MKIICDSCGAKYSISDDKVQGKVFKIRCKKCSEVIVVEGEDDATDSAENQQDDYAGAYDSGGAAEWYVVLDGERVGPVAADEVEGYFSSGQLHAESYIWKEGFEDWVMLETVSEFSHLTEEAAGPSDQTIVADQSGRPVGADEGQGGADQHDSGGFDNQGVDESGGYDSEPAAGDATAVMDSERFKQDFDDELDTGGSDVAGGGEEIKQKSGKFAAVESGSYEEQSGAGAGADVGSPGGGAAATGADDDSDQGGMFAAFDAEESEPQSGGDAGGLGGGGGAAGGTGSPDMSGEDNDLVGQRNENSVLFSLSNVDDDDGGGQQQPSGGSAGASPQAGGGPGGGAASNDKSGLIDIQSLASTHAAMKDGEEGGGGPGADEEEFVANTMSMPALSPSGSSSSNKGLIIGVSVAVAVLSAILAAGVVMFVVMDDDEPEDQEQIVAQDEVDEEAEAEEAEAEDEEADDEPHEAEEAARAVEEGDDEDDEEAEADDEEEEEEVAEEEEEDEEEEQEVARQQQRDRGSTGGGGTGGSDRGGTGGGGGGGTTGGGTDSSDDGGGGIAGRLDDDGDDEPAAEETQEDLPERLSRSMVQETIQRYTSRVNDCAETSNPDDLTGSAMVRFQVTGSGSVTSADAQDEFSGTEVGSCIEDVVRQMRFPETEDDSRTINYPFTVR